jgi:hypothetical protein
VKILVLSCSCLRPSVSASSSAFLSFLLSSTPSLCFPP